MEPPEGNTVDRDKLGTKYDQANEYPQNRSYPSLSLSLCDSLSSVPVRHLTFSFPSFDVSPLLPEYVHRIFQFRQMDFDYAASQIVDLILRPSEIAKTVKIRKQIKNQWARDDPAFVIILMTIILLATIGYCIGFATSNIVHILRLTIGGLLFEFLLCGCTLVTFIRWYINKKMRIHRLHTVEQSIEWLYAFDVHCNALFASFLLVSISQYCMLPIILAHGFLATALANTIWLAGVAYYAYITFIGYSGE